MRLGDVDHEVGTALELVPDAHHGDEEPQVGRDRLLAREEQKRAIFDGVGEIVDLVVVLDHLLRGREVAVEQCRGTARDRFCGQRGETDHVDAELVERLVKCLARFFLQALGRQSGGHGPIVPARREFRGSRRRDVASTLHCSFT